MVVIDSRKILQVLQNLIGNAIKYSPSAAKIALSSTSDGQSVSIIVQDNGPGIPKDELNSIFTPFRRSRVAGAQHGTGLGLAICKWIVEMHGGKIWAENAVGGGAIFHISLMPRSESEFTTAGTL